MAQTCKILDFQQFLLLIEHKGLSCHFQFYETAFAKHVALGLAVRDLIRAVTLYCGHPVIHI